MLELILIPKAYICFWPSFEEIDLQCTGMDRVVLSDLLPA